MHSILDFTEIPEPLKSMVGNYHINLLDIKKIPDTSVYKTDLRQVFDFIRFSDDDKKLENLVKNDNYYTQMDEEAYDLAMNFTKSEHFIDKQQFKKGGKINMCKAFIAMQERGIKEGILGAIAIMKELDIPPDTIKSKIKKQYKLTNEQIAQYLAEDTIDTPITDL